MNACGWCKLTDLHELMDSSRWTEQHILTVVQTSSNRGWRRFELGETKKWIRATWKHTCLPRTSAEASSTTDHSEDNARHPPLLHHATDASMQTEAPTTTRPLSEQPPLASTAHVQAEPQEGHVPLRRFLSSTSRRGQCQTWWICEDEPADAFREDEPHAWQIYRDPEIGLPYWWHEHTKEWFWRMHLTETHPEGNVVLQRAFSSTSRSEVLLTKTPCIWWKCEDAPQEAFREKRT